MLLAMRREQAAAAADAKLLAAYKRHSYNGAKSNAAKEAKILNAAIKRGRHALLREMMQLTGHLSSRHDAALYAIAQKDSAALKIICEATSKSFSSDDGWTLMRRLTGQGMHADMPLILPLTKNNQKSDVLHHIRLAEKTEDRVACFTILAGSWKDDEDLAKVLDCARRDDANFAKVAAHVPDMHRPGALARLYLNLLEGEGPYWKEWCETLIEMSLNPNYQDGRLMTEVLSRNMTDQAELLLQKGYDLPLWHDEVMKQLSARGADGGVKWLRGKLRGAAGSADGQYTLAADDMVSLVRMMKDGGSLRMIFNFTTRQQVVLVQGPDAQAPAAAVVDFADIRTPAVLASAAKALIEGGGDAALEAPFVTPEKSAIRRQEMKP